MDSRDSFPALAGDDQKLLQTVLKTAQEAIRSSEEAIAREARERLTLEGTLKAKIADVEENVAELRNAVADIRGMSGDLRAVGARIDTLNNNVMEVLKQSRQDASRMGEMELKIERIASGSGSKAGAKWGGAISAVAGLLYWLASMFAASKGIEPPKAPELPAAHAETPRKH